MQTVETLNEGLKRAYRITISRKEIDARVDGELRKVAPQIRMPGFRPGKVPPNLVRKMHGAAIEQDALNTAVQEGVQQLLAEQRLRPAMQPSVELEQGGQGTDAVVKVELETLPEMPDPRIEGLKLERLQAEPSTQEVEDALKRLAAGQKSFDPAPAAHQARAGDLVVIDYEGMVDGEAFDGGKGESMRVELGSGRLIPGFEEQLVGAKANDQREVRVIFPDDYPVAYLKGREAEFEVTVGEVQMPRAAALDDAFAQSMGLEGIDQLRQLLRGQIEQELNGLTRTHMKRKLLDQLAATHDFPVPASMVEAEFAQIWQQLEHEASHEPDPEAARAEMEAERGEYHAIAERRVRLGLLLSEIGQREGIGVAENEMNQLIMQAAQQYKPEERQKFVDYVRAEPMAAAQLRAPLFEDKVVDFLFGKAEVSDRKVTRETLTAEIEAVDEPAHVHGPGCGHDHEPKAKKGKAKASAPAVEAKPAKSAEAAERKAKNAEPASKANAEPEAKKAKAAKPAAAASAKPARKTAPAKPAIEAKPPNKAKAPASNAKPGGKAKPAASPTKPATKAKVKKA